jgi:hypothetical protein
VNLLSHQIVLGSKIIFTEYDPDFNSDKGMSTTRARKRGEKRNPNATQSEEDETSLPPSKSKMAKGKRQKQAEAPRSSSSSETATNRKKVLSMRLFSAPLQNIPNEL